MAFVFAALGVEARQPTPVKSQEKAAVSASSGAFPNAKSFTNAPLRNRLRVALKAPVPEVWALVGNLSRFPEYSAGLEQVDVIKDKNGRPISFLCHFRPQQERGVGFKDPDRVRWYVPNRGYASSTEPGNAFGFRNDLALTTVQTGGEGTLLTMEFYFDADDLDINRAGLDQAYADIGERLVARFDGRVIERFVDATGAK